MRSEEVGERGTGRTREGLRCGWGDDTNRLLLPHRALGCGMLPTFFSLFPPSTLVRRHMATCVSAAGFYDMNDRKDWIPLRSTAPPIPYSSSTTIRATLASPACRKGTQRRLSLGTFDSDHTFFMLCFTPTPHVCGHLLEGRGWLSTQLFNVSILHQQHKESHDTTCAAKLPRHPTRRQPRPSPMHLQARASSLGHEMMCWLPGWDETVSHCASSPALHRP
ncbi:hypothetical protein LY76DRAFT_170322 [Colletotrichum caudatum]|nr:hypothetical protein LY76DRAFT_170322 [Colletotrichum caudatum]